VQAALAAPPDPTLGDFAFPCFKLAKALKKGPPIIARELADALAEAPPPFFSAISAAGPYLNLTSTSARPPPTCSRRSRAARPTPRRRPAPA
jgi:arginyl-tRNA synthetase